MSTDAHYAAHFNSTGYCQCGCEECHLRLTSGCVCPACPCDDPADDRHEADLTSGDQEAPECRLDDPCATAAARDTPKGG